MSRRRYGSDKEVAAVTFNMKEQRCLEKSLQTLTLEKTYSLKLLDLNHRIIRVNYRRLKDKVSKIKSNLSADDISELRQLESNGKLKPTYNSVNISGALKIAAAARRLKFQRPLSQRASSAHPRLSLRVPEVPVPAQSLCRSNSVTGVFIDAPTPEDTRRRASVDVVQNNGGIRPFSAFNVGQTTHEEKVATIGERPSTTACVSGEKTKAWLARPTTGVSTISHPHTHTHSPFSSHTLAEKDARLSSALTTTRRNSQIRSTYPPQDDDIDSNLGEDLYEERRQELLDEEFVKAEELELKKQEFLRTLDEYLKKTSGVPPHGIDLGLPRSDPMKPVAEDITDGVSDNRRLTRRRRQRVDFDQAPTFLPEADYRRRLMEMWKDINKCRYLRVPEELIDLTGIATLAKDQMRLFEVLKQAEPDSVLASADL